MSTIFFLKKIGLQAHLQVQAAADLGLLSNFREKVDLNPVVCDIN